MFQGSALVAREGEMNMAVVAVVVLVVLVADSD